MTSQLGASVPRVDLVSDDSDEEGQVSPRKISLSFNSSIQLWQHYFPTSTSSNYIFILRILILGQSCLVCLLLKQNGG